jgi:hypothetical protein
MKNGGLSEKEFADYLFEVCATAVRKLAELRTLDRDAMPVDARPAYDRELEGWLQIFAMTEPDVVAGPLLDAEDLARQLTLEEATRYC